MVVDGRDGERIGGDDGGRPPHRTGRARPWLDDARGYLGRLAALQHQGEEATQRREHVLNFTLLNTKREGEAQLHVQCGNSRVHNRAGTFISN